MPAGRRLRRARGPLWRGTVRRLILVLLLILVLAPPILWYQTAKPVDRRPIVHFTPIVLPPRAELARHLGAFELQAAWVMTSPHSEFGGYSALLPESGGQLLTISDEAHWLRFSPPGAVRATPEFGEVFVGPRHRRYDRDTESATQDPTTGTIWIGREGANAISRHDPHFHSYISIRPHSMRHWGINTGPEAMVRLPDGRFIVLEEGFIGDFETRLHHAVLFAHDPLLGGRPIHFTFSGSREFSPTDMARLPDGRVLILMRRLVWPLPLRFACRIVIADPATIRPGAVWQSTEVAKLSSSLPIDNFEGIAIEPRSDGWVTVWLISDDNHASTQRTLLWKLAVDPAKLPWTSKNARGPAPRASQN
jgi:hypothetical protein